MKEMRENTNHLSNLMKNKALTNNSDSDPLHVADCAWCTTLDVRKNITQKKQRH
jgi:hypothetical protein